MRKLVAIVGVLALIAGMAYLFLFKNDNDHFFDQGVEYYEQKKNNEALFYFEKSEELGNAEALKYSATIYLETNNPQKAISKFEKYISKIGLNDKNSKFVLNDLGVAYFKLNDIENAKKYWKMAAELGNTTSANNLKELETKMR